MKVASVTPAVTKLRATATDGARDRSEYHLRRDTSRCPQQFCSSRQTIAAATFIELSNSLLCENWKDPDGGRGVVVRLMRKLTRTIQLGR